LDVTLVEPADALLLETRFREQDREWNFCEAQRAFSRASVLSRVPISSLALDGRNDERRSSNPCFPAGSFALHAGRERQPLPWACESRDAGTCDWRLNTTSSADHW